MSDPRPVQADVASEVQSAPPSRLHGVIDVLKPTRIAGWVIDRADAGAAVTVDILRDGVVAATAVADRYRADLEKGGIGTGRYGFLVELDPPVPAGFEFTVGAVARISDGEQLALKPVGQAVHPVPAEYVLLQRLLASVQELGKAVETPRAPTQGTAETLARIEIVLARLERSVAALEERAPAQAPPRFRFVTAVALAAALASAAAVVYSFWGGWS